MKLEAREERLGVWLREGKESQRMPRPLPWKLAETDRHKGKRRNVGGKHGGQMMEGYRQGD